jgi:hypothetical protein
VGIHEKGFYLMLTQVEVVVGQCSVVGLLIYHLGMAVLQATVVLLLVHQGHRQYHLDSLERVVVLGRVLSRQRDSVGRGAHSILVVIASWVTRVVDWLLTQVRVVLVTTVVRLFQQLRARARIWVMRQRVLESTVETMVMQVLVVTPRIILALLSPLVVATVFIWETARRVKERFVLKEKLVRILVARFVDRAQALTLEFGRQLAVQHQQDVLVGGQVVVPALTTLVAIVVVAAVPHLSFLDALLADFNI